MRIGLDIDDTITNTHSVLMKYAIKYNKEKIGRNELLNYNTNNFMEAFNWTFEEMNNFFDTYYLESLNYIEPKEFVKEVLTKLRNLGHKIVFITVRNDKECKGGKEALRITTEWLNKYEIPYDELNMSIKDKKEFCKNNNIDIFVDDSEKHCKGVSELGIKTYIMDNFFNKNILDIARVFDLNDLYLKIVGE